VSYRDSEIAGLQGRELRGRIGGSEGPQLFSSIANPSTASREFCCAAKFACAEQLRRHVLSIDISRE